MLENEEVNPFNTSVWFAKMERSSENFHLAISITKLPHCQENCTLEQLLADRLRIRSDGLHENAFVMEETITQPQSFSHPTCRAISQEQIIGNYFLGIPTPFIWETNILLDCTNNHYWVTAFNDDPQPDIILLNIVERMLAKSLN